MVRRSKKPMPHDFGWRWLVWLLWSNILTVLLTIQAIFLQLTLDPESLPRNWVHRVLQAANIIGIVVAQVKRNNPPPPRPRKPHK